MILGSVPVVSSFGPIYKMGLSCSLASSSRCDKQSPGILVCRKKDALRRYAVNFENFFCSHGGVLMRTWLTSAWAPACRFAKFGAASVIASLLATATSFAQSTEEAGGEAALKLPDLSQVQFLGVVGHTLLLFGILFCVFGLIFGLVIYRRLKNLPVH